MKIKFLLLVASIMATNVCWGIENSSVSESLENYLGITANTSPTCLCSGKCGDGTSVNNGATRDSKSKAYDACKTTLKLTCAYKGGLKSFEKESCF